jgi:hypothetical protein
MQYPVQTGNDAAVAEALNYLLSGPAGLGQSFDGTTGSATAYLTGNFRKPYTVPVSAKLYVPEITLSRAEMLDNRTFKYTFATTQATPPFSNGNGLSIFGFTNDIYNTYPASSATRNSNLVQIGVVECTTTYVIIVSAAEATIQAPETTSTAKIFYYSTGINVADPLNDDNFISTDGDVRVTVTGGNQRVVIGGQADLTLNYTCSSPVTFSLVVEIDRYAGFTNNNPTNPDFLFNFDATLAYKVYTYSVTAGTGTIGPVNTYFTSLLDNPPPGYWRYFYNIGLGSTATTIPQFQITDAEVGLRMLTAQVLKQ